MSSIQRFEDLFAWQKARELTQKIYTITMQGDFSHDFGLRDQIRRASISIMSNIAEGFERSNPGDYQRFLLIAKASCGELRSQLYIAYDVNYINAADFIAIMNLATETSRIINGLWASVNRQWKEQS